MRPNLQEDTARNHHSKPPKICVFHNIVAPYRLPLFDRLSLNYDVAVLFGLERPADRLWTISLDDVKFTYRILPARLMGPLVLNPGLAVELSRRRPDIVIHADSDESLASMLVIFALRRLLDYKVILWVEHVPRTEAALRVTRASRRRLQWPLTQLALWVMMAVRRYGYGRADALLSMSGPASDAVIFSLGRRRPVFIGTQVVPSSILASAGPRLGNRQ